MSRRRRLSDEEHALWSGYARSIKPLRKTAAAETDDAVRDEARAPPRAVVSAEPAVPTKRPPLPLAPFDRRLKQRVARGRDAIDARIDLHGMTQRQAHTALTGFLHQAQASGARVVLVVTGKGAGKNEHGEHNERGVLRRQVPLWLALPEFRHFIVGFEEAHASHGGQGALYVRLRRAKR
jgi:DNA-nicking Smr family endonuclease